MFVRLGWTTCQGQTFWRITKIRKLRTIFYNIGPWAQCCKAFYVLKLRMILITL
jgi:hypothetical protein